MPEPGNVIVARNLNSFSVIHQRVNKCRTDYCLSNASTAFMWLALETFLGLSEDEIEEALTDGPMDGGIDAIHIYEGDVHVFNFKYTEDFDQTNKHFPETEIDKLLVTMGRIYGGTIGKDDINDALWDKVCEIRGLFQKGPLNFKYYLCSNKQQPIEHARRKLETTLDQFRFVEYIYIDQAAFVSKILDRRRRKVNGALNFIDKQYFERSEGSGIRGIVATVSAMDIIDLVRDLGDQAKINEDVFNENVRVYLKRSNSINRGIFDTALSPDNHEFWFLNNVWGAELFPE